VAITPEAPDLPTAFLGGAPSETLDVSSAMLDRAWEEMSQAENGDPVDSIILGCPHFSYDEFRALAEAIEATPGRVHENVQLLVLTSSASFALAQRGGLIEPIRRFGATIAFDTCPFHSPIIPENASVVMTNSGKAAYYSPGELGVRVAFAPLDQCVRSAVSGRVRMEGTPWEA